MRICMEIHEDSRFWERIHKDSQGFVRLWERICGDLQGFASIHMRLWERIHRGFMGIPEDSQDFGRGF